MEQHEFGLLSDFISENWAQFVAFADERGTNEEECDDLLGSLEHKAGRV